MLRGYLRTARWTQLSCPHLARTLGGLRLPCSLMAEFWWEDSQRISARIPVGIWRASILTERLMEHFKGSELRTMSPLFYHIRIISSLSQGCFIRPMAGRGA